MLATTTEKQSPRDDYARVLTALRGHFASVVGSGVPLFTTDAEGLFAAYIAAMPDHERQHHTCHCCRRFVETFGGLVSVAADGSVTPALWGPAPDFYGDAHAAVARLVRRARITGVFVSDDKTWGTPITGDWSHMSVIPPASMVYRPTPLKTAFQSGAEKKEDYGMLCRGLADFPRDLVAQAATHLGNGALYRSEKCEAIAKWLLALHDARSGVKGRAVEGVTWLAVATAPPGFTHVRTSMIGTLLEALAEGMDFAAVKARFDAKMHPLAYQRPQAAPSAGNIAQAEKVFAALGCASSLERRYARIEEITTMWRPTTLEKGPDAGGIFGHLTPKGAAPKAPGAVAPAVTMTWEKFARTVLPDAVSVEYAIPPVVRLPLCAYVTAVHADAPPIIQWDSVDARNPVSLYVYSGGSLPSVWGLVAGRPVKVTAFALAPSMWSGDDKHKHHGKSVLAVLDGCKDGAEVRGAALFLEFLRSELREVRSTLEAYSASKTIAGREDASACGLVMSGQSTNWNPAPVFAVTSRTGTVAHYRLDRWD